MKDLTRFDSKDNIVNSKNKNFEKKSIDKNHLSSIEIEDLENSGWITKDGGLSYTKSNVYGVANFTILT